MEDRLKPTTNATSVAERVASGFSCVPPSFELIPKLLLLLDDARADGQALADLIRVDAGLTADILRVANSAFYARGGRVGSLLEAANRIGFREIYRTVVDILASPILDVSPAGLARLDLWRHSLAAALAAKTIAENTDLADEDIAFTGALLHDVGKIALGCAFGNEYGAVIEQSKALHTGAAPLERVAFDTDHAQVGSTLLKLWNFPEPITTAILFHHAPEDAPAPGRPCSDSVRGRYYCVSDR
jgi:putative nucleotidyltransferase with HDIG domain